MQEVVKGVESKEASNAERARKTLARSYLYSFLSRGFAYPTEEGLKDIKDGVTSRELKEAASCLGKELLGTVEALCQALETEVAPLGLRDMEGGYNRLFAMGLLCPHHETFYAAAHVFMKSQDMADIRGFYEAFGFRLSEKEKELADFIATELEFMYALCFKEYHAIETGAEDKADLCRETQAKFLEGHLGTWAEAFARTLATVAHMDYFITLARLLKEFVDFDCQYLGVSPKRVVVPEQGWSQGAEPFTCGENPQEVK
jgi:DMSO reductase family type II enzyme chaperone